MVTFEEYQFKIKHGSINNKKEVNTLADFINVMLYMRADHFYIMYNGHVVKSLWSVNNDGDLLFWVGDAIDRFAGEVDLLLKTIVNHYMNGRYLPDFMKYAEDVNIVIIHDDPNADSHGKYDSEFKIVNVVKCNDDKDACDIIIEKI